jgi:hypothetical protein
LRQSPTVVCFDCRRDDAAALRVARGIVAVVIILASLQEDLLPKLCKLECKVDSTAHRLPTYVIPGVEVRLRRRRLVATQHSGLLVKHVPGHGTVHRSMCASVVGVGVAVVVVGGYLVVSDQHYTC